MIIVDRKYDSIDWDGRYIYIQYGKEIIQVSRELLRRIELMIGDEEE